MTVDSQARDRVGDLVCSLAASIVDDGHGGDGGRPHQADLPPSAAALPFLSRMDEHGVRKAALAAIGASLVRPGATLFLDGGTTNLALARVLPSSSLSVVTNNVSIAAALAGRHDISLKMVGSIVDPDLHACVDAEAILSLDHIEFDQLFLGVGGLNETGVYAFDAADAACKRVAVARSREVIALVLNDKVRARAPHCITRLDRIDRIVLEHDADRTCRLDLLSIFADRLTFAAEPRTSDR